MSDNFQFLKNPVSGRWVILAPKRAKRPDVAKGIEPVCPFCEGKEEMTPPELYRAGSGEKNKPGWEIRVVPNLYAFAPVHEIIIHSPQHADGLFKTPEEHLVKLLGVYKQRYSLNKKKWQVFIFHNHQIGGGESLPHPHSQVTGIPLDVQLSTPRAAIVENPIANTDNFTVYIPQTSAWPYEIWFLPKKRGRVFDEITDEETRDLARLLKKVLNKLEGPLGSDFPFNFYIYQGGDWYLRIIPRVKVLGGFEVGSGVYVNTQSPQEAAKELSLDI